MKFQTNNRTVTITQKENAMAIKKLKFRAVTLELDHSNPDTPAMVYKGRGAATYDAAMYSGTLDTAGGTYGVSLDAWEVDWLASQESKVEAAMDAARDGNPDYA